MIKSLGRLSAITAGTDLRSMAQSFALLTIGAGLMAFSLALFLAPFDIAPGGVSGLAIIINEFTGWQIGLVMLVLNIPMLWLGFRQLGRFRFLVRTAYVVLLYSLSVDLMTRWISPEGISQDLLLNALYGGFLGGIGTGLVYRGRGSAAGTGILGRVIQIKTGLPVSQVYVFTDGAVVIAAGLVFGWERALYAMIAIFVWGLAADFVLEGPSVVRTAFIVTNSARKVSEALLKQLGVGVTAWPSKGMFTDAEHSVLFCAIGRPDANALRAVVAEADPEAFVVIGHGHQAKGGVLRRRPTPGAQTNAGPHPSADHLSPERRQERGV